MLGFATSSVYFLAPKQVERSIPVLWLRAMLTVFFNGNIEIYLRLLLVMYLLETADVDL